MTAYVTRAPSGIPGELSRLEGAVVVPVAISEAIVYGKPVKMVGSEAANIDANDTAANFFGVLQRSAPAISTDNTANTADTDYVQNVIRKGFVSVACPTGTPAMGGQVYMRVVEESSQLVGDFEASYDYGLTAAAMVGTGNATAGTLSADATAAPGVYRVLMTAATAFNLVSPSGDIAKVGATGAAYTAMGLTFTVTVGGTPAIAGDYIPLTLVSNNVALPGVTFASAGKDSSNNCEIQIA
jgi:hypothetical protein